MGESQDRGQIYKLTSVSYIRARKAIIKKVKPLFRNSVIPETCPQDIALRFHFSNFLRNEKIGNFCPKIKCNSNQTHLSKSGSIPRSSMPSQTLSPACSSGAGWPEPESLTLTLTVRLALASHLMSFSFSFLLYKTK